METNENPAAPVEVPNLAPLPPTPQPPPNVQAPPPATHLVIHGTKSEREIDLERRLDETERAQRAAELLASERERDLQELRKTQTAPKREREKKFGPIPIFYDASDDLQNPANN